MPCGGTRPRSSATTTTRATSRTSRGCTPAPTPGRRRRTGAHVTRSRTPTRGRGAAERAARDGANIARERAARAACRTRVQTPPSRTLHSVTPAGPEDVPAEFVSALRSLRRVTVRPEVVLDEVPGPARIAPFSAALTAEVRTARRSVAAAELASGRFVVLYDPAGQEAWEGRFRLVTLVRATLEAEVGADPDARGGGVDLVHRRAARSPGLDAHAAGGTVTRVLSQSFGALERRSEQTELEIRASWTAADEDLGRHLQAWGDPAVHRSRARTTARRRHRLRATALIAGSGGPAHRIRLKSTGHAADDWHVTIEPLRRDLAPARRPEPQARRARPTHPAAVRRSRCASS